MADPTTVEEIRRALGRRLAAYRRAAGYSQTEFAPVTGYSRSTVANVETGRQAPPRDFWQRCDAILSTGGALAATHDQIAAAVREDRHEVADRKRTERVLRARQTLIADQPAAQVDRLWPETVEDVRQVAAELWAHELDRSSLATPDPIPVALRWMVAPPDLALAHIAGWQHVGGSDIERVRAVRHNLKAIDNAHGGGIAFPLAVDFLRHEVAPLLKGSYDAQTGRELLGATAELALDVGWMAYDAGDHALATWYMTQALRFSHAADHRMFGGRILAAMSHQAAHLGRISYAVDLAQAARTGTQQVATPTVTAMLAAMEACAHAARQDRMLSVRALDVAEHALESANADDSDPEWVDFDEGGLWGHAARAHRDLHQPAEAKRYAELAVRLCRADHGRTRAQRNAILATAHVENGDADQAAAIGLAIVQDAWTLRSRHVLEEVAALSRRIEPLKTSGTAEFLEQSRGLLDASLRDQELSVEHDLKRLDKPALG